MMLLGDVTCRDDSLIGHWLLEFTPQLNEEPITLEGVVGIFNAYLLDSDLSIKVNTHYYSPTLREITVLVHTTQVNNQSAPNSYFIFCKWAKFSQSKAGSHFVLLKGE